MKVWVVSPNVTNNPAEELLWKEAIVKHSLAFMGWGEDDHLGEKFINEIKKGEFILIAQGANWQKKLFLGGIVSSDAIRGQIDGTPREAYYRKLNPVFTKEELEGMNMDFKGSAFGIANRIRALYILHPETNASDKSLLDKISKAVHDKIKSMQIQQIIDLLKFKHQIILQGPPGTGKTRLAKEIAREMTKEQSLGNPQQKTDEFFKTFDSSRPEVQNKRVKLKQLLERFHSRFPISKLIDLPLDEYAFGKGDSNTFCWWLEYGLPELGTYSGQAGKFKIFWKKEIKGYSKSGFLQNVQDDEAAMKLVAHQLSNLGNQKNIDEGLEKFSNGFVLKFLHSYFPDIYFPINNEKMIDNSLKLLGADPSNLGIIEKSKKLQDIFNAKRASFNADVTNIEFMRFLCSTFNLKEDIKFQGKEILTYGKYKIIQFHPAYSYEDFVRGIVAKTGRDGNIIYEVENKVLAQFAQEAQDNPSSKYILIIDEINRANLPSVLGELIYALEYRYDENSPNDDTTVDSMYALPGDEVSGNERKLRLPRNLYIIGTMNSADRSVGHIDYAIRRRFAFITVPVSEEVIDQVTKDDQLVVKAKALFKSVSDLFTSDLASDFKAIDVQLGHSYFLAESEAHLKLKLEYEIKPLLREYLKDGILIGDSEGKIESLRV